jgi:hypothetical protein
MMPKARCAAFLLPLLAFLSESRDAWAQTSPSVTLKGVSAGQVISGGLAIEAVPSWAVSRVDFLVDSTLVQRESASPYCMGGNTSGAPCTPWDSRTVADGAHTIKAVAVDSSGRQASASVSVTIRNGTSTSPPTGAQPSDADLRFFAGDDVRQTAVSMTGQRFKVNGTATYAGRYWGAVSLEGLLLNARMVNGIYDDLDGAPPSTMLPWDPRTNSQAFIAQLPRWKAKGLAGFTIGLQGGSNRCAGLSGDYQNVKGVTNNPYGTSGTRAFDDWYANRDSRYARYLARLGSVIRAADDQGLVVILSLFYFGQDQLLANEAAVIAAVDAVTTWVLRNKWTNALIEIANESDIYYQHAILRPTRVPELLRRVKERSSGTAGAHLPHRRLLVSVSGSGGYIPPDAWIHAADFVLLHGNGRSASGIKAMIDQVRQKSVWRAAPKPIVFNEDSTNLDNFRTAVRAQAGWGYFDDKGYQCVYGDGVRDRWSLGKATNPDYWPLLAEMTGH